MIRTLLAAFWVLTAAVLTGTSSQAQDGNPFAPVAIVNDSAITNFELSQRMAIMEVFRAPGDLREEALKALIDDRLRMQMAAEMGIIVEPEAVESGMEEFAGRASMDTNTFLSALSAQGIATETFRDFVEAGVAWREVVGAYFGPRASVSEAEVDRALSTSTERGDASATLAEIILPARDAAEMERAQAIVEDLRANVRTTGAFAAAAREYSASPTGQDGGRLPRAMPLSELPPPIRAQLLTLAPGELTEPINAPNAIAIFQLIGLTETGLSEPTDVTLTFARYLIPGGRTQAALTEAAKVRAQVDNCDDLYGVNKGQSPARLTIETLRPGQVSGDIGMELAKLDAGEISTALSRGNNLVMLMLCSRNRTFDEEPNRRSIRAGLTNQRLGQLGDQFLAELKSAAIIRYP